VVALGHFVLAQFVQLTAIRISFRLKTGWDQILDVMER